MGSLEPVWVPYLKSNEVHMLTQESQLTAIAEWIAGRPTRQYEKEDFSRMLWRIWSYLRGSAQPATAEEREHALVAVQGLLLPYPGGSALYQAIANQVLGMLAPPSPRQPQDAPGHPYLSLYELDGCLRPVEWLWRPWLPRGMLAVLAARPGVGKSLVALDLMRIITSGGCWPDGAAPTAPGANCIYVDAENIPAVLSERARQWEAWGMDRRRVFPLLPAADDGLIDLASERYRDKLWEMADRLEPALIVVDSLRDILPAGEKELEDVRETLRFLTALAAMGECAVLVIHHLRKRHGSAPLPVELDDVSGSGYITGHARVVMGLSTVGGRNGPRRLEVLKTNLSAYPSDLGITFEQQPPDGLRLLYGPAPASEHEQSLVEQAAEWLLEYLSGGPARPAEVIAAGGKAGFSRATIYRARDMLNDRVVNTLGRQHPHNEWRFVGDGD